MKTQIESYLASVAMLSTSHLEEMAVNLRKAELNAIMTGTKGLGLTTRIKNAVEAELNKRYARTSPGLSRRIPA